MRQIFLSGIGRNSVNIAVENDIDIADLKATITSSFGLNQNSFYLCNNGNSKILSCGQLSEFILDDGCTIHVKFRILGGIDFQHREGSKIGSGGLLSESQAAVERRERLRKLALETIDLSKDPYFMRNHLGSYECKLCLTLHNNEGNYLAHTQGKRHQSNLARRAAMEARNAPAKPLAPKDVAQKRSIKIGRPGYKVTKSRDLITRQRSLAFEIDYPESEPGVQPRHRFMSAYEQKVETPDKNYQYVLFACDPYEIIAFKIPNHPVDKREGRFFTNWDANNHKFILQICFLESDMAVELSRKAPPPPPRPTLSYH